MILKAVDKEIITDSRLKITENIFEYDDSIIQLSNVSQIYATKRKVKVPLRDWIIIAVFFFIVFKTQNVSRYLEMLLAKVILIYLIVLSAILFEVVTIIYDNWRYKFCLVINLNSGLNIYFVCSNIEYARKVTQKVKECIKDGTGYVFNFTEETMNKIEINGGNVSGIIGGKDNSIDTMYNNNAVNEVDWSKWDKAIEQSLEKINKNSSYYSVAKEAEMYVKARDKEKLGRLIGIYAKDFLKNVLVGITANEARTLISMILK